MPTESAMSAWALLMLPGTIVPAYAQHEANFCLRTAAVLRPYESSSAS